MEKLEKPKDAPKGIRLSFEYSGASGNEVLNVRGLSFAYPSSPMLIDSIDFTVRRGDKLFLVGPNGCGKSTLIKLLLGRLKPTAGYIEHGYNVNVGYYDQENQNLTPSSTVLDELWNAYPSLTETEIRNTLALFRFIGDDVYKLVGELSGGERARLTLSKLILHGTNLLILDEPTNHLDIDSREALEGALEEYEGTVVIVSHDRYFIEKLSTRLIDMLPVSVGGGFADIGVMHKGAGYGELCRDRERRAGLLGASAVQTVSVASSNKELYLKKKKEEADARNAQKRLERLRAEAEKIENEIDCIDAQMSGDAAYDYKKLAELEEKKGALEERLLEIYEEI
jgi:ATP-binding cassette subfamily F protein 3